jgi:hypothetical protein
MEMKNGMVVWAPSGAQMNEIRRRVSKERAKATADVFRAVRALFRTDRTASGKAKHAPADCPAGA